MTSPTSSEGGVFVPGDALRLVRALISPGKVFEEVKDRAPFWTPWIAMTLVAWVTAILMRPFSNKVSQLMMDRLNRPFTEPALWKVVIGPTIGVLALCAVLGGLAYVLVAVVGGQTSYKKMVSVVLFSLPLTYVQQLIGWALLTMKGVNTITGPQDMMVSLGIDNILLSSESQVGYFLRFILTGIGPLQIWQLAIVAVGFGVMGKLGKGQAWTAAILYFAVVLVALSGLGAFGMSMMARAAGN